MKKNIIFYACAAAALVFASCQKETPATEGPQTPSIGLDVITATTVSTKTTTQDGVTVLWDNGDQIGLYTDLKDRYVCAVYTTELTSASETATFVAEGDKTAVMSGERYYAIYPAASFTQWSSDMTSVGSRGYAKIPASQTAVKGGWDRSAGILAASSNTSEFVFNHVSAYVKFTVASGTTPFVSMSVASIGGETLSDDKVNIYYDADNAIRVAEFAAVSEKSSVVTLSNGGAAFEEGTYYVAFLPGTYAKGLAFSFENAAGKVVTVSKATEVTMEPGDVANIGTIGTLQFTESLKLYSVYEENDVKQGVVFWVDPAKPTKGMIVSPSSSTKMVWAKEDYAGPAGCGADLNQDSVTNFNEIVNETGFSAVNYPAAWYCYSLGEGWRLPSIEEFQILFNSYYGKDYSATLKAGATSGGTDYRTDEAGIAAKSKFDAALGEVFSDDTLDSLDSDELGTIYWLDEEAKASGSSQGKNAYAARIGMYYYKNYPKTTEYRVRCIRNVEVQ